MHISLQQSPKFELSFFLNHVWTIWTLDALGSLDTIVVLSELSMKNFDSELNKESNGLSWLGPNFKF